MLLQETFSDESIETLAGDCLVLRFRGSGIYVSEPHIPGGMSILSKAREGIWHQERDFLGITLCSMNTLTGNIRYLLGLTIEQVLFLKNKIRL